MTEFLGLLGLLLELIGNALFFVGGYAVALLFLTVVVAGLTGALTSLSRRASWLGAVGLMSLLA